MSIDADLLADLKRKLSLRGESSDVLDARLEFADANQLLTHYIQHFVSCDICGHTNEKHDLLKDRCTVRVKPWGETKLVPCPCPGFVLPDRVHPHILPTQASLRWSTTDPPLTNFPEDIRNVTIPDPGWFHLYWDWSGIEFRMATAYGQDPEDVEALAQGKDIHSIMAWRVWPELTGVVLSKKDRRRQLGKIANYTMIYGPNEYAMLEQREVEQLGVVRADLLKAGRVFIHSHPGLMAARKKVWEEAAKTREARTMMGARRRLFGHPFECSKQGWSHTISGSVANMLDYCVVAYVGQKAPLFPGGILAVGRHDSAEIALPRASWSPQEAKSMAQPVAEKVWEIAGQPTSFPADWKAIYEDGRVEVLK